MHIYIPLWYPPKKKHTHPPHPSCETPNLFHRSKNLSNSIEKKNIKPGNWLWELIKGPRKIINIIKLKRVELILSNAFHKEPHWGNLSCEILRVFKPGTKPGGNGGPLIPNKVMVSSPYRWPLGLRMEIRVSSCRKTKITLWIIQKYYCWWKKSCTT